jgi:pimeloyl-ACP methyl ester carboxylesterase
MYGGRTVIAMTEPVAITDGRIGANGLEVAYLEAGRGPLALCLHGFPDSAWTWRHLLPNLAAAGFHAVAPFLRGYAPTSIPDDGHYQAGALAADAVALHDVFGAGEPGVLIGHDWGAIATYAATGWQPERWRRAVAIAVPPLGATSAGLLQYDQLRRSWYMFFFQHPFSDGAVAADDLAFIDRLWGDWSPGYDANDDLARVKDALRDPDNLAAALGYYRAMLGDGPRDPALDEIDAAALAPSTVPTLYLHGDRDGCMGVDIAEQASAFLPAEGSRVEIVGGTGHFLHLEAPESVNRLIVQFLAS